MTPLTIEDLKTPYAYVVVEGHLQDVRYLLQEGNDDASSPSWLLAGGASRTLLALEGLGQEIWKGVDVDRYLNELRDGWDR